MAQLLHFLCAVFCFTLFTNIIEGGKSLEATVYKEGDKFTVKTGVLDKEGLAYGVYNDTFLETGWGVFNVKAGYSSEAYDDNDLLYAAGMLEGFLTAKQIYQHSININATFYGNQKTDEFIVKVEKFFSEQDTWMRKMMAESASDPYWQTVSLVIRQYDGLIDGYNANAYKGQHLTAFDFQTLNGCGDLLDLRYALMPESIPDWEKMTRSQFSMYLASSGHCSALVKVLPGYEDVFMSHSSWFVYQSTLRIYKNYDFQVSNSHVAGSKLSFSSYPGFLESLDDFYIIGNGLVMLQTTNNVFNKTLYKAVKPSSLFAWQRVRVANFIATGGESWAKAVAEYNSGTYNNQYMIIDTNKIKPKEAIMDDALWVIEQVPTLVVSGDQSSVLRTGYWPSYNVPFYEKIYNISGYRTMYADKNEYQLAPRAEIFRRDEGKVTDMESMKKIMRFNDYLNDPYSDKNPANSICMRGDLMKPDPAAVGCYDTKVTNLSMVKKMQATAINGPTLNGGSLQPFSWSPEFKNVSHVGLPDTYNFDFKFMQPLEF